MAGKDSEAAESELLEKERKLHEDFAYIAECNIGSEYMSDERLEKLRVIASKEWLRYFDDSLGLSWAEAKGITHLMKDWKKYILSVNFSSQTAGNRLLKEKTGYRKVMMSMILNLKYQNIFMTEGNCIIFR